MTFYILCESIFLGQIFIGETIYKRHCYHYLIINLSKLRPFVKIDFKETQTFKTTI